MKTLKLLWINHKKALSDAFSYTIDDTIATEVRGRVVRPTLHTKDNFLWMSNCSIGPTKSNSLC